MKPGFSMHKEYDISKTSGLCCLCGKELSPGEQFVATVKYAGEELHREDFCTDCWDGKAEEDAPDVLGIWEARLAKPKEKKKLFVDDELLIDFFQRLEGACEPLKVDLRFVLALVLMRKKLLVYDSSRKLSDGRDLWTMHFKGGGQTSEVVDPHLDEQRIADLSRELGEILEAEL